MAIGKKFGRTNKSDKDNGESLENLIKKFNGIASEIKNIKGGRKDKKDFSADEVISLRSKYSEAAQIAYTISKRSADDEASKKYKEYYEHLSNRAASFGSVINSNVPSTTFDDVKGLENVKKLVKSFLFMANKPDLVKYYKLDGGLGMLMYGAPGTGKTMIAEAIANAMNLPLFIVTPADIFKSYVGESEQAVKQIFSELDACEDGAILFVDECESIFSKRTQDTKDYKAAVTTELLQRINGFGSNGSKRILMAATNRPDVIDPAYLRYKRFSHLIHITPPDITAKRAIIEAKLEGIALDGITTEDVLQMSEKLLIKETPLGKISYNDAYYSAADLCGIIEEAARIAMEKIQEERNDSPIPLTREMFEAAFNKISPSISNEMLEQYENFNK